MDVATVTNLLGSYVFPIVACVAMGWYVKYITDKHREEIEGLNARHNEEMSQVTDALNNNTLALQRLCDKLGD